MKYVSPEILSGRLIESQYTPVVDVDATITTSVTSGPFY